MARSTITGGKQVAAAFRQIVPGLSVPLNEASRKAMAPMVRAAKAGAPVDDGDLKRSMVVKRAKSPKASPVHVVGPRADFVGKNGKRPVKYAHVVEFGRAANADGKGGFPGLRFMTKAFEATAQTVIATLESEIPVAIAKRVAKLRAKGNLK